jgi:hypothetical protein
MVQVEWNMAPEAWTAALAQCPEATYFHTEAWLQTVHRTFGCELARVRVVLPDGQWALLPLTVRSLARGLLPLATAGETGAYCGFVSPRPLSPEAEALAFATIRRRYPDLWVTGNPFARRPDALPGGVVTADCTHVLPLRPLSELRAGFSRGCKARGNKARKGGLTLRMSADPADAAVYYALYEDTVRRWGEKLTWARPRAFFEHLLEEGGAHVRLLIAYDGDRPVAALVFAAYGEVAHYMAGATLAEALPLCPNNFLMEEAMAHYAGLGFRWLDFGPSNGLEGVVQFKESFGATPLPFGTQRTATLAGKLYFALRRPYERLTAKAGARDAPPPARSPRPVTATP